VLLGCTDARHRDCHPKTKEFLFYQYTRQYAGGKTANGIVQHVIFSTEVGGDVCHYTECRCGGEHRSHQLAISENQLLYNLQIHNVIDKNEDITTVKGNNLLLPVYGVQISKRFADQDDFC